MPEIKVIPLGAGKGDDVPSCMLLTIGGKNIILDCGINLIYSNEEQFPDFSCMLDGTLEDVDCVIISNFHLDHCGALPYLVNEIGYRGPIFMTKLTKPFCMILLDDYRKIAAKRKGKKLFRTEMILQAMAQVTTMNFNQTIEVDEELKITTYHAGHVMGAAMFLIEACSQSVVYTGTFSMTSERRFEAASINKCRLDALIIESPSSTKIRDSNRHCETDFLKKIHNCIERDGKVLIPVFTVGQSQELCILLELHWESDNLVTPLYFSPDLFLHLRAFYDLYVRYSSTVLRRTNGLQPEFDFKHAKPFKDCYITQPGPMVVVALHATFEDNISLDILQSWASDENNMVIMPGCSIAKTIGHQLMSGADYIKVDEQFLEVKLAVEHMSFTPHTDLKGILQLTELCRPEKVLLAYGEESEMQMLKTEIQNEIDRECFVLVNGEAVTIPTKFRVLVPKEIFLHGDGSSKVDQNNEDYKLSQKLLKENERLLALNADNRMGRNSWKHFKSCQHATLRFMNLLDTLPAITISVADDLNEFIDLDFLFSSDTCISALGISIKVMDSGTIIVSWDPKDTELAEVILERLQIWATSI